MRLRYLHLPRCGPLVDIGFVFGQEEMLFGWHPDDPAKRKGAINFVVGVNGTGKSSLLRAIYQTLHALKRNEMPAQPLTLAWDRTVGSERVTGLLHCPSNPDEAPWFAVLKHVAVGAIEADWLAQVEQAGKHGPFGEPLHYVGDSDPITTSLLQAHLPSKVVAYTSGAEILWEAIQQPGFHSDTLVDGEDSILDDRPPGWTIQREQEEQRLRGDNVPTSFTIKATGRTVTNSPEFLTNISILTASVRVSNPLFLVRQCDLRLAAITLSLWQGAQELKDKNADWQRDALRGQFIDQKARGNSGEDARRVLSELDWFWPTHLSFTYRDADDRVSKTQQEQLLCLLALADEVTRQPLGRHRAVISLGPVEPVDLKARLDEVLPNGLFADSLERIISQAQGSLTGAEAVIRVFSSNQDLDATLFDVFNALREWQAVGLLEDITLTIKRLSQITAADGEQDDAVVTFDQLSDGEQMLLGRVGLLFLLRGQDGALLLLDEPETHFNDVWKRQIIDLVDDAVLKTTSAQVLISTHTSITLTDVFSSEIVRLSRRGGNIEADTPAFPTFGADPGRILLHVFGSPDVIGSRAVEFLREKLKKEWTANDRAELHRLVNEIGSGWPRAKLAEILVKLDVSSYS